MKRLAVTVYPVVLCAAVFFGCSPSSNSPEEPDNDVINNYSGSASKGDVVVFTVNQSQNTVNISNETTAFSADYSYSDVSMAAFTGAYQVTVNDPLAGAINCFAVELGSNVIASNFPTNVLGAGAHYLSFGVSSSIDNTGNENSINGDYVYIIAWDGAVNGSTDYKEWGLLRVNSDGTWKRSRFATGGSTPLTPADPAVNSTYGDVNYVAGSGDDSGIWSVNGINKERVRVVPEGSADTLSGFTWFDSSGNAIFLLDLGLNQGYMLGFKQPQTAYTSADVAGSYKFVDIWYDDNGAWPGAGNYTIAGSGSGTYAHIDCNGTQVSGSLPVVTACSPLKNVFVFDNVSIDTGDIGGPGTYDIYIVVVKDVIMHFTFDDSTGFFVSYGSGARI